jgi:RNA-binding protein YhbY
MPALKTVQLGKKGLTDNFVETLRNHFKNHLNIKISVLKSLTRDRKELREISEKILEDLGKNYTCRIIGYTLVIKKWRKPVR